MGCAPEALEYVGVGVPGRVVVLMGIIAFLGVEWVIITTSLKGEFSLNW